MNYYFQSVTGAFTFPNLYKKVSTIFDGQTTHTLNVS